MLKPTKSSVRKTIHRTTSEVPLKIAENRTKVLRHSMSAVPKKLIDNNIGINNASKHKYHSPEINTLIDLDRKMENMQSKQSLKLNSLTDLTPRTNAIVSFEKTKKLNFPPDKTVYKNLIPININDSVLMVSNENENHDSKSLRKKYIPKVNKDPIPELSDFLSPIKPLELKLQPYDKPDILRKPKNNFYPKIYKICTQNHPGYKNCPF